MYIPTNISTLEMQRVSIDDISTAQWNQVKKNDFLCIWAFLAGRYIACIYDDGWFIGNVIEVSDQNHYLGVKSKSLNNNFNWPLRDHICKIPVTHVLCTVIWLSLKSAVSLVYCLSNSEFSFTCKFIWQICSLKLLYTVVFILGHLIMSYHLRSFSWTSFCMNDILINQQWLNNVKHYT